MNFSPIASYGNTQCYEAEDYFVVDNQTTSDNIDACDFSGIQGEYVTNISGNTYGTGNCTVKISGHIQINTSDGLFEMPFTDTETIRLNGWIQGFIAKDGSGGTQFMGCSLQELSGCEWPSCTINRTRMIDYSIDVTCSGGSTKGYYKN